MELSTCLPFAEHCHYIAEEGTMQKLKNGSKRWRWCCWGIIVSDLPIVIASGQSGWKYVLSNGTRDTMRLDERSKTSRQFSCVALLAVWSLWETKKATKL